MLDKTRSWEATVRMNTLGESQEKECLLISPQMEENGSADVGRKIVNKMMMTLNWAIYDGEVPKHATLRSILGWRTTAWWRKRNVRGA